MKRGEVWWVAFDPAVGSEIPKDASRGHCQQRRGEPPTGAGDRPSR